MRAPSLESSFCGDGPPARPSVNETVASAVRHTRSALGTIRTPAWRLAVRRLVMGCGGSVGWVVVAAAWLLGAASPAAAHKATVFVVVQNGAIVGEAYFWGGTPIRDALVTVLDAAGHQLGQTRTDPAGKFVFRPQSRCDHRVVVDAGDGHTAEATVRADELPSPLPAAAPASGSPPPSPTSGSSQPSTAEPKLKIAPLPDAADPLRTELEAIQAQLVQLRRELAAMEQKTQWRDILGGIGYIVGLAGIAYYYLGVRRKERQSLAASGPQGKTS